MHTSFFRSWGGKMSLLAALFLLFPCAAHAQETTPKDAQTLAIINLDNLLQQSDDAAEVYPLATLYERVVGDAVNFPRDQTSLEFQRQFNEMAPSFGSALSGEQDTLSQGSAAGQALQRLQKEQAEKAMFSRNLRFIDVYLIGKYLSVFMNGDAGDSAFDLFVDADDVQQALTGAPADTVDYLPPRFSQGITNVARYLKGTTAQAIQADPNIRNQRIDQLAASGTISFQEDGIPVCSVPGVVQGGPATDLDDATKKAILGRLVDLEDATKSVGQTIDNTQLLNRQEDKDIISRLLAGENIPNWNGCLDAFCLRVDFINSVPQLAPPPITRPLPLIVALQSIQETARKLSNTPLETKYVGRSMASFSFFSLDFNSATYNAAMNFELRFVPIFQAYDSRKAFNMDSFDQLVTNYTSLLTGDLDRAVSTAINPDRLPGSQVLEDSARQAYIDAQKKQHKATMILRTIIYWNQSYLKVVGDRLQQLSLQTYAMQHLIEAVEAEMYRLNQSKVVYSK